MGLFFAMGEYPIIDELGLWTPNEGRNPNGQMDKLKIWIHGVIPEHIMLFSILPKNEQNSLS